MKGKLTDREKAPVIKEKIRKRNMQKPAESRQKEIREFNQCSFSLQPPQYIVITVPLCIFSCEDK